MRPRLSTLVLVGACAIGGAAIAGSRITAQPSAHEEAMARANAERFATLTFGDADAARRALDATGEVISAPDAEGENEADDPTTISPTQYRTPNGWLLRPAGTQIDTSRSPTGLTVTADNQTVFAVTSGIFDEELVGIDAATLTRTLSPAPDLYLGVVTDGAGNLWGSGGAADVVYQFRHQGPVAVGVRQGPLLPMQPNQGIRAPGYPGTLVTDQEHTRLFIAGNISMPESAIAEEDPTAGRCPAGRPVKKPVCSVITIADITDPTALAPPTTLVPVGRDAFDMVLREKSATLYVTNWADHTNPSRGRGSGTVSVVSTSGAHAREVQVVQVGKHPTGIAMSPDQNSLVVTNSADDTISVLALGRDGRVTGVRTVSVRPTPSSKPGATPLSVGFSPDGRYLYVGMAGENLVEVRTPSGSAIPRAVTIGSGRNAYRLTVPHTYIPTGWYPSALVAAPNPDDSAPSTRLYVTNLKGVGAGAGANAQASPFVGSNTQGTVSAIDIPKDPAAAAAQFTTWTAQVVENNRWLSVFEPRYKDAAADPCKPAPKPDGGVAFSQLICDAARGKVDPRSLHVVYVIKENKTFDQYFGDLALTVPGADASPEWLLYGAAVTTNQHLLAQQFTVSDNFWADSEQSTLGHSWTSAGYATEANEITWNPNYAEGIRGDRTGGVYDGREVHGFPPGGAKRDPDTAAIEGALFEPRERFVDMLMDPRRNKYGATFRVYSDDVTHGSPAARYQVPLGKWGIGPDAAHHGRDLDFPDNDRINMFLTGHTISNAWGIDGGPPPDSFGKPIDFTPAEKQLFSLEAWTAAYNACRAKGGTDTACQRAMPNFIYMALPVDHTLGFNPGAPTPASMVAENDRATGRLVEGLSNSPFWKNTLIMITEDDTQLAGDHVDAHRTFLLTAGGLARQHGKVGDASHQPGSFPSVLKTAAMLFGGLPPLTLYDANAVPLHDLVVGSLAQANHDKFVAVAATVPLMRNPLTGLLGELSSRLDWSRLDSADPDILTALIYAEARGRPVPLWVLERLGMDD